MTSTNDGKDVKSNPTCGPKGKTYYIELYKSLDAHLSSECELRARTQQLCAAWRRIHCLCQHSAASTHPHLLSWLQRHTARTILQTEWQSPDSKDCHTSLLEAFDAFNAECAEAEAKNGRNLIWETQLVQRSKWFSSILANPWEHPVLRVLLDSREEQPSDDNVLEWLKQERGVMFVTRLRQLCAAKCDDLAISLASAVMDRVREGVAIVADVDQLEDNKDKKDTLSPFGETLKSDAGFTADVWELLVDIEFMLLYKSDKRAKCIELAKQTPLRTCYLLVDRLGNRLATSPKEKRLWKNAKDVAALIAQVVIARCMVVPRCTGSARSALYWCSRALVRLLCARRLPPTAAALAAPAATARHLHTLACAVHAQASHMTAFVVELYVRAITAGMNELERLKIKTEESEARALEQTLSAWFTQLGGVLSTSTRISCECALTAFSVHPSPLMYDRMLKTPQPPVDAPEVPEQTELTSSEFGSWANDSRSQTNLVKTSETLNLKFSGAQTNVLSNAFLSEGEAIGLSAELCNDLAVLLAGPRLKTLSWDMDRNKLLETCRIHMERTQGGTKALTTELKYLNLNLKDFQHLPEEGDDENDVYYGIEKGYEHLVEFQEPEKIWEHAVNTEETASADSDDSIIVTSRRKKKKKPKSIVMSEDDDPLSVIAETKAAEKKVRPLSKERSRSHIKTKAKTKHKSTSNESSKDNSRESSIAPREPSLTKEETKKKPKEAKPKVVKEKKERKPRVRSTDSLIRLIGKKIAKASKAPLKRINTNAQRNNGGNLQTQPSVTDSDYDSQGKSSLASITSEDSNVVFDGLYSMDDNNSPEKKTPERNDSQNIPSVANSPMSLNKTNPTSDVKSTLSKLIKKRQQQRQSINNVPMPQHRPVNAINNPKRPLSPISPKFVSVPEIPKSVISKAQTDLLFAQRKYNNRLNQMASGSLNNDYLTNYKAFTQRDGPLSVPSYHCREDTSTVQDTRPRTETSAITQKSSQTVFEDFLKSLEESYRMQAVTEKAPAKVQAKSKVKTKQCKPSSNRSAKSKKPLDNSHDSTYSRLNYMHKMQGEKQIQQASNNSQTNTQTTPFNINNLINTRVSMNPSINVDSQTKIRLPCKIKKDENIEKLDLLQSKGYLSVSKVNKNHSNACKDIVGDKSKVRNTTIHNAHVGNKQAAVSPLNMLLSPQSHSNQRVPQIHSGSSTVDPVKIDSYNRVESSDQIIKRDSVNLSPIHQRKQSIQRSENMSNMLMKLNTSVNTSSAMNLSNRSSLQSSTSTKLSKQPAKMNSDSPHDNIYSKLSKQIAKSDLEWSKLHERPDNIALQSFKQKNCNMDRLREQSTNTCLKTPKQNAKPHTDSLQFNERTDNMYSKLITQNFLETNSISDSPHENITTNIKSAAQTKYDSHNKSNQDWESVMDAIIAQKTPCRGPNALDMALNKHNFQSPSENKLRYVRKGNSSKSNTEIKEPLRTDIKMDATNHSHNEKSKSHDSKTNLKKGIGQKITNSIETGVLSSKVPLSEPLKDVDPFISGIPNSDYDLLEELMDDDLRQEIGELSDEERFSQTTSKSKLIASDKKTATTVVPLKQKTVNVRPKCSMASNIGNQPKKSNNPATSLNVCKNVANKSQMHKTTNVKSSPVVVNKTRDKSANVADNNWAVNNNLPVQNMADPDVDRLICVSPKVQQFGISKNKILNSYATNLATKHNRSKNEMKSLPITNQDQYCNNMNTESIPTNNLNVMDSTNIYVTSVQQQLPMQNVVLIGSDVIYNPYASVAVQDPQIQTAINNINQNAYLAINSAPDISLYQAPQFAAPIVNSVIINDMVVPTAAASVLVSSAYTQVQASNVNHVISSIGVQADISQYSHYHSNNTNKSFPSTHTFPNQTVFDNCENLENNETIPNGMNVSKGDIDSSKKINVIQDILFNETDTIKRIIFENKETLALDKNLNMEQVLNVTENTTKLPPRNRIHPLATTHADFDFTEEDLEKAINQSSLDMGNVEEETLVVTSDTTVNSCGPVKELTDDNVTNMTDNVQNNIVNCNNTVEPEFKSTSQIQADTKSKDSMHSISQRLTQETDENLQTKDQEVSNIIDRNVDQIICRPSIPLTDSPTIVYKINKNVEDRNSKDLEVKNITDDFNTEADDENCHTLLSEDIIASSPPSSSLNTVQIAESAKQSNNTQVNDGVVGSVSMSKILESKSENYISANTENITEKSKSVISDHQLDTEGNGELPHHSKYYADLEQNASEIHQIPNNKKKFNDIESKKETSPKTMEINTVAPEVDLTKDIISDDTTNMFTEKIHFVSLNDKRPIPAQYKKNIIVQEIAGVDDPAKKCVRIRLPNGKNFKATISGQVINYDSLFSDPTIKSILMGEMDETKKYTLNIKQVSTVRQDNPAKIIATRIQNVHVKTDEVINLVSDDDDDISRDNNNAKDNNSAENNLKDNNITKVHSEESQVFRTEFGNFKVKPIDINSFGKHQEKFLQMCCIELPKFISTSNRTNSIIVNDNNAVCESEIDKVLKNVAESISIPATKRQGIAINTAPTDTIPVENDSEVNESEIDKVLKNVAESMSTPTLKRQGIAINTTRTDSIPVETNCENLRVSEIIELDDDSSDESSKENSHLKLNLIDKAVNQLKDLLLKDLGAKQALKLIDDDIIELCDDDDIVCNTPAQDTQCGTLITHNKLMEETTLIQESVPIQNISNEDSARIRDVEDCATVQDASVNDNLPIEKWIPTQICAPIQVASIEDHTQETRIQDCPPIQEDGPLVNGISVLPNCLVSLTKCDDLIKKYENLVNKNKCYVKLVKCDSMLQSEDCLPVELTDLEDISDTNLRRSGSFSILNEFQIDEDEKKSYVDCGRSSPVIDIFETIALLKYGNQNILMPNLATSISIILDTDSSISCIADWHTTKRNKHENLSLNEDTITDCESDNESVMSLVLPLLEPEFLDKAECDHAELDLSVANDLELFYPREVPEKPGEYISWACDAEWYSTKQKCVEEYSWKKITSIEGSQSLIEDFEIHDPETPEKLSSRSCEAEWYATKQICSEKCFLAEPVCIQKDTIASESRKSATNKTHGGIQVPSFRTIMTKYIQNNDIVYSLKSCQNKFSNKLATLSRKRKLNQNIDLSPSKIVKTLENCRNFSMSSDDTVTSYLRKKTEESKLVANDQTSDYISDSQSKSEKNCKDKLTSDSVIKHINYHEPEKCLLEETLYPLVPKNDISRNDDVKISAENVLTAEQEELDEGKLIHSDEYQDVLEIHDEAQIKKDNTEILSSNYERKITFIDEIEEDKIRNDSLGEVNSKTETQSLDKNDSLIKHYGESDGYCEDKVELNSTGIMNDDNTPILISDDENSTNLENTGPKLKDELSGEAAHNKYSFKVTFLSEDSDTNDIESQEKQTSPHENLSSDLNKHNNINDKVNSPEISSFDHENGDGSRKLENPHEDKTQNLENIIEEKTQHLENPLCIEPKNKDNISECSKEDLEATICNEITDVGNDQANKSIDNSIVKDVLKLNENEELNLENNEIGKDKILGNSITELDMNALDTNLRETVDLNKNQNYKNADLEADDEISGIIYKKTSLLFKHDSGVILKGIEYKDPVIGTCYVFPITKNALSEADVNSDILNDTTDMYEAIQEIEHLASGEIDTGDSNEGLQCIDDLELKVIVPVHTYSKTEICNSDVDNTKSRKNLKRKLDTGDVKSNKKYRKGKNIDYPKFTAVAIADSAYAKEFKLLFDYYSSLKFSYSRPFHIEHFDVSDMLHNWPKWEAHLTSESTTVNDIALFSDNSDAKKYLTDPVQHSLTQELTEEYNEKLYRPSNINEVNFNMGFGEGSGRVILNLEDGNCLSNFSAATLSDVKRVQPSLLTEDYNNSELSLLNFDHSIDKNSKTRELTRHFKCIQLRDKVRSFFKKSTIELRSEMFVDNKYNAKFIRNKDTHFPYDLCTDFFEPLLTNAIVNVVQVGQLPVSAAAQNPVTCDPRVTQVSDASPSQCSDNSLQDGSPSAIKTEYTELTTADLSMPLVHDYGHRNRTAATESQETANVAMADDNIPIQTEIKSDIKIEMEIIPESKDDLDKCSDDQELENYNDRHDNTGYNFESNSMGNNLNVQSMFNTQGNHGESDSSSQQNGTSEKTDQLANAMNAAGISTTETVTESTAHALVNILSQKLCQAAVSTAQTSNNFTKTTSINAMSLQQALAQILPPPLNQTNSNEGGQTTPQVLHIVQGKNASGNQITLVENTSQSVINTPNSTPVLHIVQSKSGTSNGAPSQQTNSFSGLSLVDAGLQSGGNQLLHIVNAGNQKGNAASQLIKRVNLLTNLANVQGSNEQKMVQFVCKSADGKSIQLNAPHQRSMVLRLQPIETPNMQTVPQKTSETQDHNASNAASTSPSKDNLSQQEIKSRSVYEDNYAKFIQNSSTKSTSIEQSTSLPKFNQAFGKAVFQEGNQKPTEINANNAHIQTSTDNNECPTTEGNSINLDHIGQISSPPLLLRKSPAQTSQTQSNLVQQLKQTIAPMNIQTMHGGVIYTRQIPVNIGGGQTINLITVPSTELMDESVKKQQNDIEPSSIIKIVPQAQPAQSETRDESNNQVNGNNENQTTPNPQPQPVLTQMRIKLPMLSKTPQMLSGGRVVRPSFFQIQRNVIGGANQPVYQQLVLTAAPPLGQQTIRLPQAQARPVKVPAENQSPSESQMSSSTLEQLREFDMVLEQVKERSTVQPNSSTKSSFPKAPPKSTDVTDSPVIASSTTTETTQQVLYSIGNNHSVNVAYVNRKTTVTTTPSTSNFVRSPDSTAMSESPSSSTHQQITHTVTSETTSETTHAKSKSSSKTKTRPKASSNPPNTLKLNPVPPKTTAQKPLEDEQTTQRILYILAEYKEQVENSPDKDKPAPRRRTNPPTSGKKKKGSSCRRLGMRDMSPVLGEDTCRTMGSEDSSCGTSQGDCNESCMETHSPQDSPRKIVRKLTFEHETMTHVTQTRPQPQRNVIVADGQTITVARGTAGKPATAVLMPTNYILPVSMVKGGQQIAIVTNRGPKLLTVGGEGGGTNTLLLQRLIGPAGLKPVLTRPGVRHVRLPTSAIHNLQTFNLTTATSTRNADSSASSASTVTPPELIDTRANSSPWTDRSAQEVKPERSSSPEGSEPWNLPTSADPQDYSYEETARSENIDRTVLVVQKKEGSSNRQHRLTHVSAAALRHKYAILEHELRLQKSLSEECSDLGVDSPSAAELFPEAELLFASSPAHEHAPDHAHAHTPPTAVNQSIPQPDIDDQIATDQLLPRDPPRDLDLGLDDVGIVTVSEDGMQATIALDQEEFARSHPNTTFHREPTDNVQQPFTISGLKTRHITSTIFHSNRAPATVLMTAPPTTVISQARATDNTNVKYSAIGNMIHNIPSTHTNMNLSSVLVKEEGLTRFDRLLNDSRELHLSNTASAIVHSSGNAAQVIKRVCYDEEKRERESRFLIDETDALIAGDDAKMVTEDSSRDATLESMPGDVDDDESLPEDRHTELFWESNSASERSESRRPLDFSSDEEKCCKSPSYDETNSTDSSCVGTHMRLDSVIKEARGLDRSGSADGSSADDTHPPLRTYPAKRTHYTNEGDIERSLSGKTRAGERSPDMEIRRRASGRGVVKRGCHCCNGSPAPPRPKKPRQRKPTMDFTN